MESPSEDKVSRKVYRSERGLNGMVITERGSPKATRPWSAHRRSLTSPSDCAYDPNGCSNYGYSGSYGADDGYGGGGSGGGGGGGGSGLPPDFNHETATPTLDNYPPPTGQGYQYAFATRLASVCYGEDKSMCAPGGGGQLTRSSSATYNPPGSPLPPPPGPPVFDFTGKSVFSEGELYCTYYDVLSTKCANKCEGSVCLVCPEPMSMWGNPGHCRLPTAAEVAATPPGTPCNTAEVDMCSTKPILFELCDDADYVSKGPAALKYDPKAAKSSMKKMEKYKGKRLGGLSEYGERNPGKFEAIYEYQTSSSAGGGVDDGPEAPEELGCADYVANPSLCTATSQYVSCDGDMPCFDGSLYPDDTEVVGSDGNVVPILAASSNVATPNLAFMVDQPYVASDVTTKQHFAAFDM